MAAAGGLLRTKVEGDCQLPSEFAVANNNKK